MKKNMICRSLSLVLALLTLLSFTLVFTSCGDDRSMGPTYMTIGDIEVPYDMVYCFVKQELAAYTADELKDENVRAKVRESVINNLIEKHYIVRVIAKELDLGLTAQARENIELTMEN